MMNLVIDSGATKALWALTANGEIVQKVYTKGLHPLLMPDEAMYDLAQEAKRQCDTNIDQISFYGTGCKIPSAQERVQRILERVFPEVDLVEVNTDLLGAARALCQREPGIACILGTGSNTCLYDGRQIVANKGGHGFILGDEGSGAALGKQLMIDFLNDQVPADLRAKLIGRHQLSDQEIIESVYRRSVPSRFLAGFAPFLLEHQSQKYVQKLIDNQFDIFLKKYVLVYTNAREVEVHFAGSIAWHFRSFLEANLAKHQLKAGTYLHEPMDGLARYHA